MAKSLTVPTLGGTGCAPKAKSLPAIVQRLGAVLIGALVLAWPALFNRYPLIYPDSMSYMEDGRLVARALFLHRLSPDYGGRSFIYCLGILPFHWNITPWPVVALNAAVTAYVLWLVVRSLFPQRAISRYLLLVVPVAAFTSAGWFVSLVMPDLLGPLLYLSIYLLIFAGESLSRGERWAVIVIAWWAAASHMTHLVLAAGLWALIAGELLLRASFRKRAAAIAEVAAVLVAVAGAHLALHGYLYGEPSLNGRRAPFLMARVIGDGPGRWYLQRHCPEAKFEICGYRSDLPQDSTQFLWDLHGVWQTATPAVRERLRGEETRFVIATLREYPREELRAAARNFWEQLTSFGLWDYGPNQWVADEFDKVLPGQKTLYLKSRQARHELPDESSSTALEYAVYCSLVVLIVLPLFWRRSPALAALVMIIAVAVVANALVTGVLSSVEDRYQSRVVWLLPFAAGLCLFEWAECRCKRCAQPERRNGGAANLGCNSRISSSTGEPGQHPLCIVKLVAGAGGG